MSATAQAVNRETGRSLRDELMAARDKVMNEEPEEKPEVSAIPEAEPEQPISDDKPRDKQGRFVSNSATAEDAAAPAIPLAAEPAPPPSAEPAKPEFVPAPQSWTNSEKALWGSISADAQKAILRREQDIHKALTAQDEERQLARQFRQVSQPYEAMLRAQGINPLQLHDQFLRYVYTLTTADAATKARLIQQVAQQYGVTLDGAASQPVQQTSYDTQVMQAIAELRNRLNQQEEAGSQAQINAIVADIEKFRSDPAHKYFDHVRADMGALINAGAAQSMDEAYEKAIWARPDLRMQLMAEQAEAQAKKDKERANKARVKAVSVRGSTGESSAAAPANRTLREELIAAAEEVRGRI